ncbi:MAG TPA: hypothetical protein EYQ25_00045 [Planctomycetes bacterium]|nr:hypothetical protein [Planctomycetota bacterium]
MSEAESEPGSEDRGPPRKKTRASSCPVLVPRLETREMSAAETAVRGMEEVRAAQASGDEGAAQDMAQKLLIDVTRKSIAAARRHPTRVAGAAKAPSVPKVRAPVVDAAIELSAVEQLEKEPCPMRGHCEDPECQYYHSISAAGLVLTKAPGAPDASPPRVRTGPRQPSCSPPRDESWGPKPPTIAPPPWRRSSSVNLPLRPPPPPPAGSGLPGMIPACTVKACAKSLGRSMSHRDVVKEQIEKMERDLWTCGDEIVYCDEMLHLAPETRLEVLENVGLTGSVMKNEAIPEVIVEAEDVSRVWKIRQVKIRQTARKKMQNAEIWLEGVVDCGCTDSCIGSNTLWKFEEERSRCGLQPLPSKPSRFRFSFGDGRNVKAGREVILPLQLNGKVFCLRVQEIPDSWLPLLFSRDTLVRLKLVVNFAENSYSCGTLDTHGNFHETAERHVAVWVRASAVNLKIEDAGEILAGHARAAAAPGTPEPVVKIEQTAASSSGSVAPGAVLIPQPPPAPPAMDAATAAALGGISAEKVMKIHRNLAHPSANRLIAAVQAVVDKPLTAEEKSIIKNVVEQCETCARTRSTPSRPKRSLPLSSGCNKILGLDCFWLRNHCFLLMLDLFSRYGVVVLLGQGDYYHPNPADVARAIERFWIDVYGPPKFFFFDGGPEFAGPLFEAVLGLYGIKPLGSASESPFSNGIVERRNYLIKIGAVSLLHDASLGHEYGIEIVVGVPEAVYRSCNASNRIINVDGMPPIQVFTGNCPRIPGFSDSSVEELSHAAADANDTNRDVVRSIVLRQAAHEHVYRAENSRALKQALLDSVRPDREPIVPPQEILFKRRDDYLWKKGMCVARYGPRLVVIHGPRSFLVHETHAQPVGEPFFDLDPDDLLPLSEVTYRPPRPGADSGDGGGGDDRGPPVATGGSPRSAPSAAARGKSGGVAFSTPLARVVPSGFSHGSVTYEIGDTEEPPMGRAAPYMDTYAPVTPLREIPSEDELDELREDSDWDPAEYHDAEEEEPFQWDGRQERKYGYDPAWEDYLEHTGGQVQTRAQSAAYREITGESAPLFVIPDDSQNIEVSPDMPVPSAPPAPRGYTPVSENPGMAPSEDIRTWQALRDLAIDAGCGSLARRAEAATEAALGTSSGGRWEPLIREGARQIFGDTSLGGASPGTTSSQGGLLISRGERFESSFVCALVGKKSGKALFLDLFSGIDEPLSQSQRKAGRSTSSYDTGRDPRQNLALKRNVNDICEKISSGRVGEVYLATPCTNLSNWNHATRNQTGWSRSKENPEGDGVSEKERLANELVAATVRIIKCCLKHNVPFALENPTSSLLWSFPEIRNLLSDPRVTFSDFHMCAFGTEWMKPTRVMGTAPWIPKLKSYRCNGKHVHEILQGWDPIRHGKRTDLAKRYPEKYCDFVAGLCRCCHVQNPDYSKPSSVLCEVPDRPGETSAVSLETHNLVSALKGPKVSELEPLHLNLLSLHEAASRNNTDVMTVLSEAEAARLGVTGPALVHTHHMPKYKRTCEPSAPWKNVAERVTLGWDASGVLVLRDREPSSSLKEARTRYAPIQQPVKHMMTIFRLRPISRARARPEAQQMIVSRSSAGSDPQSNTLHVCADANDAVAHVMYMSACEGIVSEMEGLCFLGRREEKDGPEWREAKSKELQSLSGWNTYQSVSASSTSRESSRRKIKPIPVRWVLARKLDGRLKARLVVKGFLDFDVDLDDCFSPTATRQAILMLLTLATAFGWDFGSMDVSTAFLQSETMTREVYVVPPKEWLESPEGRAAVLKFGVVLWLLLRPLYGLNDAPRRWNETLKKFLVDGLGLRRVSGDLCQFVDCGESKAHPESRGMLIVHVDDIFWIGNAAFREKVIRPIGKKFKLGSEDLNVALVFTGARVTPIFDSAGRRVAITLDQTRFIEDMPTIDTKPSLRGKLKSDPTAMDRPLEEKEISLFLSGLGCLNWVSCLSHPEVGFEVTRLSCHRNDATVRELCQLSSTIVKLKERKKDAIIYHERKIRTPAVVVWHDASHNSLPRGKSAGAWLAALVEYSDISDRSHFSEDEKIYRETKDVPSKYLDLSLLGFKGRKIVRVAKGSFAAELLEATQAIDGTDTLFRVLALIFGKPLYHIFVTDSLDITSMLRAGNEPKENRLAPDAAIMREFVNLEMNSICFQPTQYMVVDPMTKTMVHTKLVHLLTQGRYKVPRSFLLGEITKAP